MTRKDDDLTAMAKRRRSATARTAKSEAEMNADVSKAIGRAIAAKMRRDNAVVPRPKPPKK